MRQKESPETANKEPRAREALQLPRMCSQLHLWNDYGRRRAYRGQTFCWSP